jgi:anti-sigma factor RsiW
MNCQGFKAALHAYFARRLARAEERELEAHAGSCPECGALLRLCREISCKEFVELLNEYVDGELDASRRAVFDRHLSVCPDCTNYLDSYKKTMQLSLAAMIGAPLLAEPPPAELVAAVLEARKRAK